MNTNILSDLIIKNVYSVSTMYTDKCVKVKRENRPSWGIVIKYEGQTEYTVKNKKYISDISHMVILPKGCSYEWSCTRAGHFCIIEFDCDTVCEDIFYFPVKNGDKMLGLFKELEYKSAIRSETYKIERIRDVYTIILNLLKSAPQGYLPVRTAAKLAPAVDYIAKNYNAKIRNEGLAELCGLSTVYFRKLFSQVYGISPMAYVQKFRIEKAAEMLKSDYGSITDIAQSLGYLNIYDFSRAFKKHMGISPSKY